MEATRIARAARESELATARIEHEWRARVGALARTRARRSRRPAEVARRTRGRPRRVRRRRAHDSRAGQRQGRPARRDRRLPRGRGRLRTRGRSLPRRSAPARHRRTARACGGRLRARARTGRRPLRLPDRVGDADGAGGCERHGSDTESTTVPGLVALSSVVRVNGPFADVHSHARSATPGSPTRTSGAARRSRADAPCRSRRWPATCSAVRIWSPAASRRRRAASSRPSARSASCATRIAAEREELSRLAEETAELRSDDRAGDRAPSRR